MRDKEDVDIRALADLATPWCLRVAATLRIADHVQAGTTAIDDLAAAAGVDRDALQRVLRHLVSRGVFEEPGPGRFMLNGAATAMAGAGPGFDLDGIGGRLALAWGGLLDAVRTGETAFVRVFGRPFWEDLDADPEVAASYDAMTGWMGHGTPDPEILVDGGWRSVRHVVDVGGGTGSLLASVLAARPQLTGTLVDLPGTVARSGEVFRAAGVDGRVTAVGQSFFDPLPAGADVYTLHRVLSDWSDREAVAILYRCAEAAGSAGRVVVVGGVEPDGAGHSPGDLPMMVLFGGRVRSLTELAALAAQAGLEVRAHGCRTPGRFLVECAPLCPGGS
jgi:hypothetical protein